MGIKDMAKIKRIEILLDKYWEEKTSVDEETELKDYFNGDAVAKHLEYVAPLFQVLRQDESKELSESFDRKVIGRLDENGANNISKGQGWVGSWMRYAAAILIFLGIGYLAYLQIHQDQPQLASTPTQEDTFETPEEAYAQLKSSLIMVSSKMNKGNNYVNELNRLNTGASLFNKQKKEQDEN